MPLTIAPSILSAHPGRLSQTAARLAELGLDHLHLDVMDGCFVPEITFGASLVRALRDESDAVFDAHLMVADPARHLETFAESGADWITLHYEATPHIHRLLTRIRQLGKKAGVSINPGTPVEMLAPLLDIAELFLVMSVNPGWGGQAMIPVCLDKVRWLKERTDAPVMIDGGVNARTIADVAAAGTDLAVVGSALFRGDPAANLAELRTALA